MKDPGQYFLISFGVVIISVQANDPAAGIGRKSEQLQGEIWSPWLMWMVCKMKGFPSLTFCPPTIHTCTVETNARLYTIQNTPCNYPPEKKIRKDNLDKKFNTLEF